MPIAAVPEYLGQDFSDASPGLRFGMYLKLWGVNRRTQSLNWTTHDLDYEVRGQQQQEREVKKENKVAALSDAKRLTVRDQKIMKALAARQSALSGTVPAEQLLRLDAIGVAPFTTGLGNEHPLENGFSFLNPYGLPYLPGSGVKGVLRQAARELASGEWGETKGWRNAPEYPIKIEKKEILLSMLDVLFGRETPEGDSKHVRGALSFWDVIPQIEGDSLMVEIMTPHQAHYYQQKLDRKMGNSISPHDSGQPNPISFLTVPERTGFAFHVVCDLPFLRRLAPELAEGGRWKALLTVAFEHAFAWLGFGAKTAVGYGAMRRDEEAEARAAKAKADREGELIRQQEAARRQAERAAELATLSPIERKINEFLDARSDKNQKEVSAILGAVKGGQWQGDDKIAVAEWLKTRMQDNKQWKESSQAKRPEKDKEYQNTLLVKTWLEGK